MGRIFTELKDEAAVRKTPMSWAVVEVTESNGQKKEKLIINIGKMGAKTPEEGIVLSQAKLNTLLKRIDDKIREAKTAINQLNLMPHSRVLITGILHSFQLRKIEFLILLRSRRTY